MQSLQAPEKATDDRPVAHMHKQVDGFIQKLRAYQPEDFHPPCKEGCFWCCYEPLAAFEEEADYIVSGMTPEQIETTKERVAKWRVQAKPMLELDTFDASEKLALDYRRLNIPCPLLVDGKCSVYDRRPLGCREFFAHSHPENCAMPMRAHQKFAVFPPLSPIDKFLCEYFLKVRGCRIDHLGILLHNRLFGTNLKSPAERIMSVTTNQQTP